MPTTHFASPLNGIACFLAVDYTAGSGTITAYTGSTDIVAALTAQGLPSISPTAPLRFTVLRVRTVNPQTGATIIPSETAIYEATALTVTTINGVPVYVFTGMATVEGTTDQAFYAGDYFRVGLTAGQIVAIQTAVNALESGTTGTNATSIQSRAVASTAPTDGQVLSWSTSGSTWLPSTPSGGVTSVFTRTGAVVATTGDYTAAQVAALAIANNLSDLNSASTARTNLGLGTAATAASATFASAISLTTPSVLYATPITFVNTAGSFAGALTLNAQTANTVLAGPTSGGAATPTMRLLVAADMPATVVLTTSSNADPAWITSLAGSKITGNIAGNAGSLSGSITESQVTGLVADLALKAPLASPTFTGSPAAPTATTGDNSTLLATTAFVKAQAYLTAASSLDPTKLTAGTAGIDISGNAATATTATTATSATTAGSATTALSANTATTATTAVTISGTITESQVTNLVTDLGLKAALASPTFTGTPLAPTAAANTNTTQIATTAYVIGQGYAVIAAANAFTHGQTVTAASTEVGLDVQAASNANAANFRDSGGTIRTSFDLNCYAFPEKVTFLLAITPQGGISTNLATGTNQTNLVTIQRTGKIVACTANVNSAISGATPTGASLIFDIMLSTDGGSTFTSIWASTPANRIAIAASATTGSTVAFDTTAVSVGNLLRIDVIQVGSTAPGHDCCVVLEMLTRNLA